MIQGQDNTKTCKLFLETITGADAKEWKRTQKSQTMMGTERTFEHEDGTTAIVRCAAGNLSLVMLVPANKQAEIAAGAIVKLATIASPIKFPKGVAFSFDDESDSDGEIAFMCGPREGDHISDRHDVENDKIVTNVLVRAGFGPLQVEAGAAENYHIVHPDRTPDVIKTKIREALVAAGAEELK